MEILALIEAAFTVLLLFFFMQVMNAIVINNTGVSVTSERYSRTEMAYHTSLKSKNLIIFIMAALAAVAKCLHVFLKAKTEIVFTNESDITAGAFSASVVPWFNLVVTATSILYIILSFYYLSNLKDEIKMKWTDPSIDLAKDSHMLRTALHNEKTDF